MKLYCEFPSSVGGLTPLQMSGKLEQSGGRKGWYVPASAPIEELPLWVCGNPKPDNPQGDWAREFAVALAASGGAFYADGWLGLRQNADGSVRLLNRDEEPFAIDTLARLKEATNAIGCKWTFGYSDLEHGDPRNRAALLRRLFYDSGLFRESEFPLVGWWVADGTGAMTQPKPYSGEFLKTPGVLDGTSALCNLYLDWTGEAEAIESVDIVMANVAAVIKRGLTPILHTHGALYGVGPGRTPALMSAEVQAVYVDMMAQFRTLAGENATAVIYNIGGRGSFPAFPAWSNMPRDANNQPIEPANWDKNWMNNDYNAQRADDAATVAAGRGGL